MASFVEGCPAFSEGCPFSKMDVQLVPEIVKSLPKDIVEKCPAFKEGCPFKAEDSLESLYNHLSDMPPSHRLSPGADGEKTPASQALEATFRLVHEKSQELKQRLNAQCPVFATSCPFKTLTSAGEPLVQELDIIIAKWGLDNLDAMTSSRSLGIDSSPLSQSLKAGTKTVHRAAENVRFVRDFLKGAVPNESYVELLKALYHVYTAMEKAIDELPAEFRHIDFQAVRRAESLEEDLRHYLGLEAGQPLELGEPSAAARLYVDRLQELSGLPHLVVAHAYTRYLGDLSGGQILARAAKKAYGLEGDAGTAFYRFDLVGSKPADIKEFKRSYRASLDALRLGMGEADAVVAEAGQAFLMNMLLFEERDVAAGHLVAIRSLEEVSALVADNGSALKFQAAYGDKSNSGKCPFLPDDDPRQPSNSKGQKGAEKHHGTCPWPFLWLHAPKDAFFGHPVKNAGGALALYGLGVSMRRSPGRTGCGLLAAGLAVWWMKPKKRKDADPVLPGVTARSAAPPAESDPSKRLFLPDNDPRQPCQESSSCRRSKEAAEKHAGACPWPFLWLHEPSEALTAHPAKNAAAAAVAAAVGAAGLRFWRALRSS